MNQESANNEFPEELPPGPVPTEPTFENDRRVFLGLEVPPLVSATDWLVDKFETQSAGPPRLDLSQFIVVLPTLRSQHRLLQLLIQKTDELSLLFTPPTITSIGYLPEYLYVAAKPLATDLAQQIAWSKALAESPKQQIACLTGRPEVEDLQDWQPLATLISKLHSRLANDIWSFSSVAREVKKVSGLSLIHI